MVHWEDDNYLLCTRVPEPYQNPIIEAIVNVVETCWPWTYHLGLQVRVRVVRRLPRYCNQ